MGTGHPEVFVALDKPRPAWDISKCLWSWLCLCCSKYASKGTAAQDKSTLEEALCKAAVAVDQSML